MKGLRIAALVLRLALLDVCMVAAPAWAADQDVAHVLILNGADPYLPSYLVVDGAIRANLTRDTGPRVVFYTEPLDAQRFALEAVEPQLLALLAQKYRTRHIDVVVAYSRPAFDFYMRHGEQLWPGARLVFDAFTGEKVTAAELPPNAAALTARQDVTGTFALARRLQPESRRTLVITGTGEFDRVNEQAAREGLSGQPGEVEYLTGLPQAELVARVAAEPASTIVLFLSQFRDRDGTAYIPREVMRAVTRSSTAPVYGFAETFIGSGVAAGVGESYQDRGRFTAELVRAMIAGAPLDATQRIREVPSHCFADARALKRWSLDERRLTEGCDLRFAEVSVWRRYGAVIALTVLVVIAEAFLIVALVAQRRERRLAEQREQAQRYALARAARLALAGELTGAIAHEINQPLGAILTNADVGDLILDSEGDRRDELRSIFANIRRDDLRASQVIQRTRELLGRHQFERKEVDLNDVVSELQSLMGSEARRRGVTLEIRLAPERLMTMGDRIQIQQVLINLVLNAMDAVGELPEAERRVLVSTAKGENRVVLAVHDRGKGIAPEHRAKLFESFFTTKPHGTGLGLSITRTIVDAHGGRVWAESSPEEGTLFQVELPADGSAGDPPPEPA